MRKVWVIAKETFEANGVVLASEKDGGVQYSGFLNAETRCVDFPDGAIQSGRTFSIQFEKFEENLDGLYSDQSQIIQKLQDQVKALQQELTKV